MMQRLRNSWDLMEHSVNVLRHSPRLLLFPIVTFFCMAFIVVFFLGALVLRPTGFAYTQSEHWQAVLSIFQKAQGNEIMISVMIGLYFFSMVLATFFNVAFYHEIMEALTGKPVSIRRGLGFALSKLTPILMWSLLASAVGLIIRFLEERVGFIGKIVLGIIGLAWSVAAVFAIPVLVCENENGPVNVLKNSAALLKKTWGETLIGYVGLNLAVFVVCLGALIPMAGLFFLGIVMQQVILIPIAIVSLVIFYAIFLYFTAVASHIFRAAMYVFASTGTLPAGYTRDMMAGAWKHKKA